MKTTLQSTTTLGLVTTVLLAAVPGTFAAEDFLEKMKKAAEQLQQLQPPPPQQPQRTPSQRQAAPAQPASQNTPAQTGPAGDCCTPEATAKMAASAGFVDIVGIKLGMTPEQALAAVKAANPAFKIDLARLPSNWDYMVMSAQGRLATDNSPDPKKRWVHGIQGMIPGGPAAPSGYEEIQVGLTVPPNPQVVYGLSRQVVFPEKARPAVENVIAG